MRRPQFDIRNLLLATALIGCLLTFLTQPGTRMVALLITLLLANVLAVIVTLVVYVMLPMIESFRSSGNQRSDAE